MRRVVVLGCLLCAAVAAALFARAGAAVPGTAFRTADAGAACRLQAETLVCSSLGSRGSLALTSRGAPRVVQALPWWDASTPVVARWRRGRISCRTTGNVLVCTNGRATLRIDGDGFAVAA